MSATFAPVRHDVRMLSLDNAFDRDELVAWYERIAACDPDPIKFVGEPKLDGLAISLLYDDGRLVRRPRAATASRGEDVTANVKTIASIPRRLDGKGSPPARLEVRGEVFMPLAVVRGAEPAAGRSRGAPVREPAQRRRREPAPEGPARSPRVTRPLDFFAYQLGRARAASPAPLAPRDARRGSRDLGLPVNPHIEQLDDHRRRRRLLRAHGRQPPLARLRDRRRGREGRRPRAAGGDGLHQQGAALGDRVQVPAGREDHAPASTSW